MFSFWENFVRLPWRADFRILAARARGQSDALDGQGVFAIGGRLKQGWLRAPYHRQIGRLSRPS